MIEVENLVKRYGTFEAVKSISFTAEPGQVTGFLGPNGAGKTTTMRMLTGFMPPTDGKAVVAGYDVFDQSMDVRRRVGYLPENVPLYRDMTTRNFLLYVAEIRGVPNRRQKADEVLERVQLADRAHSRIRALSKGMRQRVGLAQALIHDPDVLILDEPTIGLDPIQVLELRDLVRDLGQDHTVLFSTHILSEAEQVCNKVIIINQGEVVGQGAPADLRGELMRGSRVLVRVDGDGAAVKTLLSDLPSVAEVHEGDGVEGFIITPVDTHDDPRPRIAEALVNAGHALIEMRPLAVNLEEIFLELTRRQQSGVTPPDTDASPEATPDENEEATS